MVQRSAFVYGFLKSEARQTDGFSPKEIHDRVSQIHNITPGKGLKKQINVALRRGIDFGILTRQRNKYRFNLDSPNTPVENVEKAKKRKSKKEKLKRSKSPKTKDNLKSRSRRISPRKRFQILPPRPRVLPPPDWTSKKRNIRAEPIPKFIRHTDYPPDML